MSAARRLVVCVALAAACRAPERGRSEQRVPPIGDAHPEAPQPPAGVDAPAHERSEVLPAPVEAPVADTRPHGARLHIWSVRAGDDASTFVAPDQRPNIARVLAGPCFAANDEDRARWAEAWLVRIDASFFAAQDGSYAFRDANGTKASIFVDGVAHDATEAPPYLRAGWHELSVQLLASDPGDSTCVQWRTPGSSEFAAVPEEALLCEDAGNTGSIGVRATVALASADELRAAQSERSITRAVVAKADEDLVGAPARSASGAWFVLTRSGRVLRCNPTDPKPLTVFASGLAEAPRAIACAGERVGVVQAGELTELADSDGDGRADEYRALARIGERLRASQLEAVALAGLADRWVVACAPASSASRGGALLAVRSPDGETSVLEPGLRHPSGIRAAGESLVVEDEDPDTGGSRFVVVDAEGVARGHVSWPWNERVSCPLAPSGSLAGPWFVLTPASDGVQRVSFDLTEATVQGAVSTCAPVRRGNALPAGVPSSSLLVAIEGRSLVAFALDESEHFEMHARANGIELAFAQPLALGAGWEANDFTLARTRPDPRELALGDVRQSADRRRITLDPGALEGPSELAFETYAMDENGRRLEPHRAWFTLLAPSSNATDSGSLPRPTAAERDASLRAEGWEVLLPSSAGQRWSGSGDPRELEGELELSTTPWTTLEAYGDLEFEFEWRVPAGGAGAIEYRGGEHPAAFALLDERGSVDRHDAARLSGALYDLEAPRGLASFGRERWNIGRVLVRGRHVQHWLDGLLVLDTTLPADTPARSPLRVSGRGGGAVLRSLRLRTLEH